MKEAKLKETIRDSQKLQVTVKIRERGKRRLNHPSSCTATLMARDIRELNQELVESLFEEFVAGETCSVGKIVDDSQ